jgi:DNA-binding NarL/FixJ family response regulator
VQTVWQLAEKWLHIDGGGDKDMPPVSSRLGSEEPIRVILIASVQTESLSFDQDSCFEIHRCDDVTQAARCWSGATASVLLVDLERLSDPERSYLRKQMAHFSSVRVLAIADSIDDKTCENLLRMGCVGSIRREEASQTIARALRAVIAGELWFPRATLSRFLRGFLVAQDPDRLTSRESEILALMDGDLNNQQIADRLFISRETVRWHIKSLHSKLGIRTRRGLREHVRLLHRLGQAIPPGRVPKEELESRVAG